MVLKAPFILKSPSFVLKEEKEKREAQDRVNAAKARVEQNYEPPSKKGRNKLGPFGKAIKGASGFLDDVVEGVGEVSTDIGKTALGGLQTWGNQVQSVPAALFTKGEVDEQGQYTTRRNLIGNPFENVQSHVAAQREAGVLPEKKDLPLGLGTVLQGFQSANRAGQAYEEDPDISAGVKFATGVALDPSTYIGAGAIARGASKIPTAGKVVSRPGLSGKALRGALGVAEGFDNPAQIARFTAGGAAGAEIAQRHDIPFVPETAEQIGLPLLGGIGASTSALKRVDPALAKIQGREGKPAAIGFQVEWVHPSERVHHGTPNVIDEGTEIPSEWGDHGPGFYSSRDDKVTTSYMYGDSSTYKDDYWGDKPWPKPEDKGDVPAPQGYRYKPKRPLQMLVVDKPVTFDEIERIKAAAPEEFADSWDYLMSIDMPATGASVLEALKVIVGRNRAVGDVLHKAGFAGMADTLDWTPNKGPEQLNFFRPVEDLEIDFSPPTMDYSMKQDMKSGAKPVFNSEPSNASTFPQQTQKSIEWDSADSNLSPLGQALKKALTESNEQYLKANLDEAIGYASSHKPHAEAVNKLILDYEDAKISGEEFLQHWEDFVDSGLSIPPKISKTPSIGSAIKPVDPDDVAGLNQPKQKTVDEFIQFTEEQLGPQNKYGDAKSYPASGTPGAPVAGKVSIGQSVKEQLESSGLKVPADPNSMSTDAKIAKSYDLPDTADNAQVKAIFAKKVETEYNALTPSQKAKYDKLKAGDLGPAFKNAPHSVLMKEAKKGGIFGNIGGGAGAESLVVPKEISSGLTKGEKIGNYLTRVKKFLIGHGVENDAVATPIANEYLRQNTIVRTQTENIKKIAQRAERLFPDMDLNEIAKIAREYSKWKGGLKPAQVEILQQLKRSMESFEETIRSYDLPVTPLETPAKNAIKEIKSGQSMLPGFPSVPMGGVSIADPEGFYIPTTRTTLSGNVTEDKLDSLVEAIEQYGQSVADRVSQKWLTDQLQGLHEAPLRASGKTARLNLPGADELELPKEVTEVIERALHAVHPGQGSDAASIFTGVNNTLRGLWASGDASFTLIQQLPTWADNPKLAAGVTKTALKTLGDADTFAKFVEAHDLKALNNQTPAVSEWIKHNLHISGKTAKDIGDISEKIEKVPGIGKWLTVSNRLFSDSGNINRVALADYLYENWKNGGLVNKLKIPEGATKAEVMEAIAKAANRATGYADSPFGGSLGSSIFFAPRFIQAQLETIIKSAEVGTIEGQVARRQMLKLASIGTMMTVAINEARGEDTIFDPRDSNFLRIRNVGGSDISIFGPWDSLIRGVIKSVPHVKADGDFTLGDPTYIVRSKLAPVLSSSIDLLLGENLVGDKSRDPMSILRNTVLPFSVREIGEEPLTDTVVGAFGGKASPLTGSEQLDNALSNAGINEDDPDYLIKKRDYLAANPDIIPEAQTEEFKRSQDVQKDIRERRLKNEQALISGEVETLAEFRENRTLLLTEQRNRLDEILRDKKSKPNTKEEKLLASYFEIFEETEDPITGGILPDAFDAAVAEWTNENGTEAISFIQRYLGAGLGEVETQYYNDMRILESAGYFDLPKYRGMVSGLTEDDIDSLKQLVTSQRISNPEHADLSFAKSAQIILAGLNEAQLRDVINSNKEAYENPDRVAMKQTYGKELLWFNPRADWNAYTNYQPRTAQSNRRGKLSGGSLKRSLKLSLK